MIITQFKNDEAAYIFFRNTLYLSSHITDRKRHGIFFYDVKIGKGDAYLALENQQTDLIIQFEEV